MTQGLVVERKTDKEDQIWFQKKGSITEVGFTPSFLGTVRDCWHILPTTKAKLAVKSPLMAIETNDCLLTIFSPSAGNIVSFNDKAQNFPDQLTTDDVVLTIDEREQVKVIKVPAAAFVGAMPRPRPEVRAQGGGGGGLLDEMAALNHAEAMVRHNRALNPQIRDVNIWNIPAPPNNDPEQF